MGQIAERLVPLHQQKKRKQIQAIRAIDLLAAEWIETGPLH